jgi:lantibiotic modifying enzyme
MALCNHSEVLHETAGLYCGSAGVGLANLDLWHTTQEERWLASAQLIGTELLRRRQTDASGLYWKQEDITPVGLAFGSAGIALFLAHLYLATHDGLFLQAAMSALDFDIAQGVMIEQGLLFYPQVGSSGGVPKSPHTRFGTAGVGSVAIRLYEISGEQRYLESARICADTCSSRYSNKLWQDYGLAGLGEFLLDMHHSTSDDFYLRTAFHLAGAILPYRIITPNGVTFAGRYLERIGCDFGEGSSGIGYFFARLLDQSLPRPLFCDEHLMVSRRSPCEEIAHA